ncbi:hypothetical protein J6590_063600 [Homalodisca vitripennis]|nr:hypothetical protein J6590_063600 [Homalodisca vitripennis]
MPFPEMKKTLYLSNDKTVTVGRDQKAPVRLQTQSSAVSVDTPLGARRGGPRLATSINSLICYKPPRRFNRCTNKIGSHDSTTLMSFH